MGETRTPPAMDADFEEVAEQRRAERRASDRRLPRRQFDTLFAAMLINHVSPPQALLAGAYPAYKPRLGFRVNLRA